jgi:FkbH-like protein
VAEADYWRVQKDYREHLASGAAPPADAVRVSLQSGSTIDPLAAYIWRAARVEGLPVTIGVGPFDQYLQEMLDPGSRLYAGDPELVLVFPRAARAELAADVVAAMRGALEAFRSRSGARLVVAGFAVPVAPGRLGADGRAERLAAANRELAAVLDGLGNAYFLDLDALAGHYGKERAVDRKLHYLGGVDFSPGFMERLAARCLTYVRLARRPPRKCLVLDLDNTLWGGVVGEEGLGGIALAPHGPGSEYADFQRAILALSERGVILAVNSKNNPGDAAEVLQKHPHMVLRPAHFAALRVNWEDKAANLREIAAELNIGTGSLVFLDDSPAERGWVREQMPEVLVPDLPADPADYAPFLEGLDAFEVLELTEEDRRRSRMYAEQAARRNLEKSSRSLEEYLQGLGIRLRVARLEEKTFARACQMIAKTNQFNLTARRHDDARMRALMSDPDFEVYTLAVSDRLGESGVTGLAVLRYAGETCTLDTLLLSCRVLGRRVEESFLAVLAAAAAGRARRLVGERVPTAKNGQTADFYPRMGFRPAGQSGGVQRFELELPAAELAPCGFHQLMAGETEQ